MFHHAREELSDLCRRTLRLAQEMGADAAAADFSESLGQNVSVRLNEIEQIEFQQDKSLDITVYVGKRKGRASTADFSAQALSDTVKAAVDIARYTAEDECNGLAEAELMAGECGNLDRYHEWDISTEDAVALAKECEQAALEADSRISNSEGACVQNSHYQYVYGNTHGFLAHQQGTRHSISCSVVAADSDGMQRDYWYDSACCHSDMAAAADIGRTAAERTARRLGSRSVPTGSYPVVFDTTLSGSLIGHLVGALSGSALYRQSSFLIDSIGKQVLPDFIHLREEPHIPRAFGSTYFDSEGVATAPRFVVENGVICGYFLSSYSARKLGMQTTANAGGAHNLYLSHTHNNQAALLKEMGSGLLITELMGQGVNTITGDYSRGAAGFWVENGVIAYPVQGITVAGRLQDMYRNISGVADDALKRSSNKIGSILISEMTVAGE
ncbi:metalloprotease PmbA [Neisseria lisongii]|uniref:Metalloprotease PmbA n=1 Tax=Neisseria lisongii TaxID=2912188 RepID=A0AAW5AK17_9NEIS|nr:metalloprotease PmbA [Neisseria lisongii]MCF7530203.1 metalloprotease PmbA [Neisseria lisongii]